MAEEPNRQTLLDEFKLRVAMAVLERADLETIRRQSLANLERWEKKGAWCSAYSEWRKLMTSGSDDEIRHVMTSRDQNLNRLRQSSPYTGFLDETTRQRLLMECKLIRSPLPEIDIDKLS